MLRNYVKPNERVAKEQTYKFKRGTTAWTKESIRNLIVDEQIVPVTSTATAGGDAMDVS